MAQRASPPRLVPDFEKAAVAAAEVLGAAFETTDFVNLEQSTIRHSGGFAQGVYAILPDKHHYDRLRFTFGPTTLGGTVDSAMLTVWSLGADGEVTMFGESTLGANGQFPPIEGENYQAQYYLAVSAIAGATPAVTVKAFVQGVHQGYVQ